MASSNEPLRIPEQETQRKERTSTAHNERPRLAEKEPKFVIKLESPIPS